MTGTASLPDQHMTARVHSAPAIAVPLHAQVELNCLKWQQSAKAPVDLACQHH